MCASCPAQELDEIWCWAVAGEGGGGGVGDAGSLKDFIIYLFYLFIFGCVGS